MPVRPRISRLAFLARNNPGLLAELSYRRLTAPSVPTGVVEKRVGRIEFCFDFDLDPDVVAMWQARYEVPIVRLMRHLLPKGGTFLDVGANIGYMSARAADQVGRSGRVISLEPVSRYYERLSQLADSNPMYRLEVMRVAAGATESKATIRISDSANIGYNSMTPNWVPDVQLGAIEEVDVVPIDALCARNSVNRIDLIKIDTEGFEIPVLEGAKETLTSLRPPVILEVTPSAAKNHGRDLNYLARLLRDLGYSGSTVEAPRRPINIAQISGRVDLLLLPKRAM